MAEQPAPTGPKRPEFAALLGMNPLFAGLGDEAIRGIAGLCTRRALEAGDGLRGQAVDQIDVDAGDADGARALDHRAGLRDVVLPKRNGPDLDDVPERVRSEMTFHLADTYADVLVAAFD